MNGWAAMSQQRSNPENVVIARPASIAMRAGRPEQMGVWEWTPGSGTEQCDEALQQALGESLGMPDGSIASLRSLLTPAGRSKLDGITTAASTFEGTLELAPSRGNCVLLQLCGAWLPEDPPRVIALCRIPKTRSTTAEPERIFCSAGLPPTTEDDHVDFPSA